MSLSGIEQLRAGVYGGPPPEPKPDWPARIHDGPSPVEILIEDRKVTTEQLVSVTNDDPLVKDNEG